MIFRLFLKYPWFAVIFHLLIGALAEYSPVLTTIYFIFFAFIGIADIYRNKDKGNLTIFYVLYLASFEIIYRISKAYLFWELGKYLCIATLSMGLLFTLKPAKKAIPFTLYLAFMLPGILVALYYGYSDSVYLRKIILQNISGPLALGFAGLYFYKRPLNLMEIWSILRIAILPSISLVTVLFLNKRISDISFLTGSNFDASGGFGPNQVSTMLGWGILILGYAYIKKTYLTINKMTDIGLLVLLAFRGLITFSRGGMISSALALTLAFIIPSLLSSNAWFSFGKSLKKLFFASVILVLVVFITNLVTGNYLFYRYMGGTPQEIAYAEAHGNTGYNFSGRDLIAEMEWAAFKDYPFLGTGVGRGTIYRIEEFGFSTASHLEFTRMISEHGLLGLFAVLIILILPFKHFSRFRNLQNRQWLLLFYIISTLTMIHSGMRLAMPSVVFGLAFVIIYKQNKFENTPLHRQPALRSRHHAYNH